MTFQNTTTTDDKRIDGPTLVFVYGSLRRGQWNNQLLADAKFIGEAWTVGDHTMLDLGAFPGVVKNGINGTVRGEVYLVDVDTAARLDQLESFPRFYDRDLVEMTITVWAGMDFSADGMRLVRCPDEEQSDVTDIPAEHLVHVKAGTARNGGMSDNLTTVRAWMYHINPVGRADCDVIFSGDWLDRGEV